MSIVGKLVQGKAYDKTTYKEYTRYGFIAGVVPVDGTEFPKYAVLWFNKSGASWTAEMFKYADTKIITKEEMCK